MFCGHKYCTLNVNILLQLHPVLVILSWLRYNFWYPQLEEVYFGSVFRGFSPYSGGSKARRVVKGLGRKAAYFTVLRKQRSKGGVQEVKIPFHITPQWHTSSDQASPLHTFNYQFITEFECSTSLFNHHLPSSKDMRFLRDI